MADRAFVRMSKRFLFAAVDTYQHPERLKAFNVPAVKVVFIVLDGFGREVGRITSPSDMRPVMSLMEKATFGGRESTAFAATYRSVTGKDRKQVAALVSRLSHPELEEREEAAAALLKMGYPALIVLSETPAADPEVKARIADIVGSLKPLQKVLAGRLRTDVEFLLKLLSAEDREIRSSAERRLRRIIPIPAPESWEKFEQWWKSNGRGYRWDAKSDRYVPGR